MLPTACFECVIGNIKKLRSPVKSKEFKLESFFRQSLRVVGNGSWKDPEVEPNYLPCRWIWKKLSSIKLANLTIFPTALSNYIHQTTQIQYHYFLETVKWSNKCQTGEDQEVFYRYQYLLLLDHCLKITNSNNSCNIYGTKILQLSHFLSVLSFDLGWFLKYLPVYLTSYSSFAASYDRPLMTNNDRWWPN